MKPYILLDTKLKVTAKNEFEKDSLKLMNDSVFGKTMENFRSHKDLKLVRTYMMPYTKYVMKPNFKDGYLFPKELFAVEMRKTAIKMNNSVYLGKTVLELS